MIDRSQEAVQLASWLTASVFNDNADFYIGTISSNAGHYLCDCCTNCLYYYLLASMFLFLVYTILPYDIDSLISLRDSSVDYLQLQFAEIDSLRVATSNLANGKDGLNKGIELVSTQMQTISEYSIKNSDVAVLIAIPLIIALFAFAFTYLFSVITRINEKYGSENISMLFKTDKAYRCYMEGTAFSVLYIILMGFLSLFFKQSWYHGFLVFLSYSSLIVAGIYAVIILWFVHTCLKYDDHLCLLHIIEMRYQKKKKSYSSLIERTNLLSDLCNYAIKEHNESFLLSIISLVNKQYKSSKNENGNNVEYYTMQIYENIVDGFIQYPRNTEFERSLIGNWFQTFRRDQLPLIAYAYRMLRKMVEAVRQGRFSLFESYIEYCRFGFDFISKIPKVNYVCGKSIEEQKVTDSKFYRIWFDLREVHYIVAAYLFSIDHYEVAGSIKKGTGNNDSFFPATVPQILKMYANCKENQDVKSGLFYKYFSLGEIIGYKYDKDILEKFTALMLLLAVQPDNEEKYLVDDKKRKILEEEIKVLIKFGKIWQKHSELVSLYPVIQDKKIEKIIDEGMSYLSTGELQDKKLNKSIIEKFFALFKFKIEEKKHKENIYDFIIEEKNEKPIRELFINLFHYRGNFTDGLIGDYSEDKQDQLTMGAYTFLVGKDIVMTPVIWQDFDVSFEMEKVFKARYQYLIFEALLQMKIKDVTVKLDEFDKWFSKLVGKKGKQYVIIDVDSNLDMVVSMDKQEDSQRSLFHRSYKEAYWYDAGIATSYLLRDVPLVELFEKKLLIIRYSDLPVLKSFNKDGFPVVNITDESSRDKGRADVRITVDPCLVAIYSKKAEVMRVTVNWR